MAKLKVLHSLIFVRGDQLEAAIACTSRQWLATNLGVSLHEIRTWWTEGSSDQVEALCLSQPFTLFVERERHSGQYDPRNELLKGLQPPREAAQTSPGPNPAVSLPLAVSPKTTGTLIERLQRAEAALANNAAALAPIEGWLLENDLLQLNHDGEGHAVGLNILESVQSVISAQQDVINQLRATMAQAQVGSCACLTKTPDPAFHAPHCLYRKLADALDIPNPNLPVLPGRRLPVPEDEHLAPAPLCSCRRCLNERKEGEYFDRVFVPLTAMQMILCPTCGNKRCPHANDHRLACTRSNEPGQPGSAYP